MDAKQTATYVAFHQLLATAAAVVGLGIVGVGAWLGFGDAARIVLNDAPQNWGDAVAAADPTTFAFLAVVGVLVWQVGKTVALVLTVRKVAAGAGGGGDGSPDPAEVKRAVMSDVNDRIASVESDVKRHEEAISNASSRSSEASAGSDGADAEGSEGESRRSRRRGSAATEDGRGGGGRGGTAESADGDAASGSSERASNRKSNRRASRASESRESSSSGDDGN